MTTFYGTYSGMVAYFAERGVTVTSLQADVEAKLVVASEWLDARYGGQFPGVKYLRREQLRDWPRTGAYDRNGDSISNTEIPREVEWATYQATKRELDVPGALSKDVTPNKYRKASVSSAVAVEYNEFSNSVDAQTKFQIIDEIMLPLLSGPYHINQSNLSGPASR